MSERGERVRPPARRSNDRIKTRWKQRSVFLEIGVYADGSPAEIFIDTMKEGSDVRDLMTAFAMVVSVGLQHGTPAEAFAKALRDFPADTLPGLVADALQGAS